MKHSFFVAFFLGGLLLVSIADAQIILRPHETGKMWPCFSGCYTQETPGIEVGCCASCSNTGTMISSYTPDNNYPFDGFIVFDFYHAPCLSMLTPDNFTAKLQGLTVAGSDGSAHGSATIAVHEMNSCSYDTEYPDFCGCYPGDDTLASTVHVLNSHVNTRFQDIDVTKALAYDLFDQHVNFTVFTIAVTSPKQERYKICLDHQNPRLVINVTGVDAGPNCIQPPVKHDGGDPTGCTVDHSENNGNDHPAGDGGAGADSEKNSSGCGCGVVGRKPGAGFPGTIRVWLGLVLEGRK